MVRHELVGTRHRYRLLDLDRVLDWLGGIPRDAFVKPYRTAIDEAIQARHLARDPIWTESNRGGHPWLHPEGEQ